MLEDDVVALSTRLDEHIDDYRQHLLDEQRREERLLRAQEVNADNIAKLLLTVETQYESTKAIVDAWSAAQQFQKFIKWISTFAVLGGIVGWLANKVGG